MIKSGEQATLEASNTISADAHSGVLGLRVVQLAETVSSQRSDSSGSLAEQFNELDQGLRTVREQLGGLSDEEREHFGSYVRLLMSDRLPIAEASDGEVVTHLIAAHDAQLVQFLKRNVGMVRQQQELGQPLVWVSKIRTAHDNAKGIDEGWISEDARGIERRMWDRQVMIGDFLMTHRFGAAGFVDLYRDDRLVIGQGIGPTLEACMRNLQANFYHVFDHEDNHAEFEHKFTEDYHEVVLWFTEPLAEHLRLAKKYGHPELLSPKQREEAMVESGSYAPLRDFLCYVFGEAPFGPVHPTVLTRAYTASGFGRPDWVEMEEQVDASWRADGAFWAIGRRFRDRLQAVRQAEPRLVWEEQYYKAAELTREDLEQDDAGLIFGPDWKRPPRQDGDAARVA